MQENIRSLPVAMPGGTFSVRLDHYYEFWANMERLQWEADTFSAMRLLLGKGWIFVDVGAWMGPMSLYAAALGAEIVAFEPDPVAFERLVGNFEMNPEFRQRVRVLLNSAAAPNDGKLYMYCDDPGNSETSVFRIRERSSGLVNASQEIEVDALSLLDVLRSEVEPSAPIFVKVDIEGFEFELIPAISEELNRRPKVALHLSTHSFNICCDNRAEQTRRRGEAMKRIMSALRSWNWLKIEDGIVALDDLQEAEERLLGHVDEAHEIFVRNFD